MVGKAVQVRTTAHCRPHSNHLAAQSGAMKAPGSKELLTNSEQHQLHDCLVIRFRHLSPVCPGPAQLWEQWDLTVSPEGNSPAPESKNPALGSLGPAFYATAVLGHRPGLCIASPHLPRSQLPLATALCQAAPAPWASCPKWDSDSLLEARSVQLMGWGPNFTPRPPEQL